MKKLFSFTLSLIMLLTLVALTGCSAPKGPVYSETYTLDQEDGKDIHYRVLLEGDEDDAPIIDKGFCSNKKGKCGVCDRYYPCGALMYTLTTIEGKQGLTCHGLTDPDTYAPDTSGLFNLSDPDNGGWKHIEVPKTAIYNGVEYPVLAIANYAFAFEHIETIKLHEGLVTLGSYAFAKAFKLKSVKIPNSVKHNSKYGYWFNESLGIEYVELGNGITFIPSYCFYDCKNLKTVKFGNAVTNMGISPFVSCTNLEYIVFPATLTTIDTDPAANGFAEQFHANVYDPFGGAPKTFKIYCEGSASPRGTHPNNKEWNSSGFSVYVAGEWEYDKNGIPKVK